MNESGRIAETVRELKAKVKDKKDHKGHKGYQGYQDHQDNQDNSQDGPEPFCCTPPGGGGTGADTKP